MSKNNIAAAEAAYAQVQNTIQGLRSDLEATKKETREAEASLRLLLSAPVPLEDLKAGIIEFVGAAGTRYLDSVVRRNISQFATGGRSDSEGRQGRPLRFRDIEGAISGESGALADERVFQERIDEFRDHVLGAFFAEAAAAALQRVMSDMHSSEFGYDKIEPHEIGSDRATRRNEIKQIRIRLTELDARKETLTCQLLGLGFHITDDVTK